jgi:hypothetical protein
MRVAAHDVIALPADALERDALDTVLESLDELFTGAAGPSSAIFLASNDAGSRTALRFWADAQRTGVAVANPELFPWCLANAPCGALARRFGITGPNATWLGGRDALEASWAAAETHLARGAVHRAFVVALDFNPIPPHPARLRAWRLHPGGDSLAAPALG